jgi:probable HAF family extracellular repeat protein
MMSMLPNAALRLALASLTLAAAASQAAPNKAWTVVELTPDSDYGGTARAVNSHGDIVGQTYTYEGGQYVSHAYLWQDGARNDIGAAAGRDTVPWAINDKGTIVGYADGFGYQWQQGSGSRLPFAGEATGINKFGTLIGHYWTSGTYGFGQDRAIMYRDGVLTELGTLGGTYSGAGGINDKGVIVGSSYLPMSSTRRAFVWQDGVMRELQGLGGSESGASRINNRGVIVGTAFDTAGRQWMVRWSSAGSAPEPVMQRGAAYALNDHGDIAGNNLDTGKPFLLESDGTLTWLLDLPAMQAGGWRSFGPTSINDRGWIVGIAWKPGVSSLGTALLLMPK